MKIVLNIFFSWQLSSKTDKLNNKEFILSCIQEAANKIKGKNELKIGHVKVTLIYMAMQLAVSLGFIYLCPNTVLAHWIYLVAAGIVLAATYLLFMKKYFHLHEEYLRSLKV